MNITKRELFKIPEKNRESHLGHHIDVPLGSKIIPILVAAQISRMGVRAPLTKIASLDIN